MTMALGKEYRVGTLVYTFGGVVVLCCWLLGGDFAWSMKERAVGSIATLMVKQFGISDFLFGLLITSFPNFTNIFLTPIISYCSDRHRGRWGRRIPYIAFTTPFVVVGVIGMGVTPAGSVFLACIQPGDDQLPYLGSVDFCDRANFKSICG